MLWHSRFNVAATAALLSLVGRGFADDCDGIPAVASTSFGKPWSAKAATYSCDTKWKAGIVVSGMEVWGGNDQVRGIRLFYSDGSESPIRGSTDRLNPWPSTVSGKKGSAPDYGYGHDKVLWGSSTIAKVRLWNNLANDGAGRVQFWPTGADKDASKILDVGSWLGSIGDGGGTILQELGSGILIGMKTQSGGFVDTVEFLFMEGTVKSAVILSLNMADTPDTLAQKLGNIDNKADMDAYIVNANSVGGSTQNWSFGSGNKYTQTRSVTQQDTEVLGGEVSATVSATAGIPDIATVSTSLTASAHWENTHMQSTTNNDSRQIDLTISQSSTTDGPLQPQTAMHCSVSYFTSKYDQDYTSTVQLTMSTGKKFNVTQPGKVSAVLYARGTQSCETVSIDKVPGTADKRKGTDTGVPGKKPPADHDDSDDDDSNGEDNTNDDEDDESEDETSSTKRGVVFVA